MGKRSDFERKPRDLYSTPPQAVWPLHRQLMPLYGSPVCFVEPCAGEGDLIDHLVGRGHVLHDAWDINPDGHCKTKDCMNLTRDDVFPAEVIITNPPWPRPNSKGQPTLDIAMHLSSLLPTWLLLSADFAHNFYFSEIAERCAIIASVGRVSWEQNGISGKDNCAWYLFDQKHWGPIVFVPKVREYAI